MQRPRRRYAGAHGWEATTVAYAGEAKPARSDGTSAAQAESLAKRSTCAPASMLGSLGQGLSSMLGTAKKVAPKSEAEQAAEEARARPADRRPRARRAARCGTMPPRSSASTSIGRWVASQTSRPELPWTFGVIDTSRDQRLCRARRLRPRDARPVRTPVLGRRSRGRARPRDQPLRATRPLQRDPQAGDHDGRQGRRDAARSSAGTDSAAERYARQYVGEAWRDDHADLARPRSRVPRRRGRGDLSRARRA